MTRVFNLLARTLRRETPPRMLLYAAMNKLHCWLKTGNRRYEFNRIFLQDADPRDYAAGPASAGSTSGCWSPSCAGALARQACVRGPF